MFHDIPELISERMKYLEQIDSEDRLDGTSQVKRLRQIPPETGKFLALLAASAPEGAYIEIGTSAGYSTLWLALACRVSGRTITTFELLPEKAKLARETFHVAQVEHIINLVLGDARDYLPRCEDLAFCFLDAEKDIYNESYEGVIPKLVQGGFLAVDNVVSHQDVLEPFIDRALADERVDSLDVPIGKGLLICRKI